ncbi:hypothetical protein [Flectobacillus roseus]|uniref:Lipoprotein n=1 Tax=Flectobacillus roseus TaxID=502259 RepID=A0ABT6YFU3_9BACT|nr:hypothetical protein [Flectobacillus roseus]MDI9862471.1 hypothetical protein [Flectobacillus roseus]
MLRITIISFMSLYLGSCSLTDTRKPKLWVYDRAHKKATFTDLINRGVRGKSDYDSLHCNGWAAFFYFTIDGNGKVKSFSVNKISSPTYSEEDSLIIPELRRILYNTEGKWHKHFWTSRKIECCFVLPYFRHSHNRDNCTEEQIERRGQIMMISKSLNRNSFKKIGKKKYKYWLHNITNVPGQY